MKFNKWTLGLAAIGVVSLASAARAEEHGNALMTALTSTTFSGYVDTSMQWNFGTGNANMPPYAFGGEDKADGFNLNVVQLTIDKPMDESEWASGYHVDLWFGPDASTLSTQSSSSESSDVAIRQAYVALRTPVGNGIDWKIGVFDSILGYESNATPNNPNYTRSYGYTLEPTTLTGVLASYRVNDNVSLSAGVANTTGPTINGRAQPDKAESYKTYMASVALTAPDNWGFLSGSTLYAGVVNGFNDGYGDNSTSWYVGSTIATPVTGLRTGISWDYLQAHNWGDTTGGNAWAAALYASYQATEKLSLHARGEYLQDTALTAFGYDPTGTGENQIWAFTATAQYDLWKNVISRLEFRWDHGDNGEYFGGTSSPDRKNAYMLAANIIYKF